MEKITDLAEIEWARKQPKSSPLRAVGDLVEFAIGGHGTIYRVVPPRDGWPVKYSTSPVPRMLDHPNGKRAWHYELDFKQ